jgi:threonylcarbamoyladenosine tRNA methylthiotransferase MtaB
VKIAVLTLGCRTNQAESFQIEQSLLNAVHTIVDISERPELCVINTCTVTQKADIQSRQTIQKALKIQAKVILTGCYSELNQSKILSKHQDIEIIKNKDKSQIINMIPRLSSSNDLNNIRKTRSRPIVKVQDGCNYSCSYCIVPLARGKSKSIEINKIIHEINELEASGYNEIVLSGIHLGSYGHDFYPKKSLSVLLKNVLINSKIPRIRLSSLEVIEIHEEFLELISDNRVCKHLHLPLQSGDDAILKLMNRPYSVKDYLSVVEKIFKEFPDIALGTDIIAGFPGEGVEEFNNSNQLIKSIPFSYLHVFPYSLRQGTKAVNLSGHVSEPVKKERVAALREIGTIKKREFVYKNIGRILDVIVENKGQKGVVSTSGNYIRVLLDTVNDIEAGTLINVQLTGYKDSIATGMPINP